MEGLANYPRSVVRRDTPGVDVRDPRAAYVQRRTRLRRSLASGLGKTALAVVIFGGLVALMAVGGDGNPNPGQSTSSIFAPHTGAGVSVVLFAVSLGVLVAVVQMAIYLFRTARLARMAREAARREHR